MFPAADWEGVADSFLAPIGVDGPLDPRLVAVAYDLELVPVGERAGRSACSRGALIRYPILAPPQRQAGVIAHELGHVALREHGEDWRDERAAAYVGAAILVPRRALLRSLRGHGPDLEALRPMFEHASPELLARRIADVGEYGCTVIYGSGKHRVKRHNPNAPWASTSLQLEPWERALFEETREHGYAEHGTARVWWIAWPGYDHAILLEPEPVARIEAFSHRG